MSDAGKGSSPRPVADRKAFDQNMRQIFGCTVKIPGGEERSELTEKIAEEYLKKCAEQGLVASMTIALMTVGYTLDYLENN